MSDLTLDRMWMCRNQSFWTPSNTREDYEAYMKRLIDPDDETGDEGHYCSPFAAHHEGCGWWYVLREVIFGGGTATIVVKGTTRSPTT